MKSVEEIVVEVVEEVLRGALVLNSFEREAVEAVREEILRRLREGPAEEVLEGVRGNLLRGLEREPVPESTVLPPPPSRRRFPREGVRMICLEDDEEGRVCYLDLGHDGAHGFELAEGGPVRPGGPVLAVDPCPGWTDEELDRFDRAFGRGGDHAG